MKKMIKIEGMSCAHCVASIKNAVSSLDGVSEVTVSLADKNAIVDFDEAKISLSQITDAIEEIGFDVVE